MAIDDEVATGPSSTVAHVVGEKLDDLSIRDFDERIVVLRSEIERLEAAKRQKQNASSLAGSLFRSGVGS